jgi:putative peptidoglycan lipid II flippase
VTDSRRDVGRAAALIGAITIGSRLTGFARMLVLVWAAGITTGVATAYQTANTIPNLIFELVAGGALAALVVPLLAAPLVRRDAEEVRRMASALLTWALTLLIPIAVLVALFARQLISLVEQDLPESTVDLAVRMLIFFAPQLPLYGVAVVLTGVLQAHRRFAWPALAPLLSSVTMIGVYVLYATVSGKETRAAEVSGVELVVLALGTTAGVFVLAGCLFIPLRGLDLRLRPRWRFEAHVAGSVKALAVAGAITLGAQQLCQALLMRLANVADGNLTVLALAQTFFLLPWAILAVPLATAAYPGLSESHALGETRRFQTGVAQTARLILLLSGLGVAALAGLAAPIATVLDRVAAGSISAEAQIAATLTGIAFGLFGYSMFAIYSRALYAVGRAYASAAATALGWAAAAAGAIVCAVLFADTDRTLALAIGWSIGMTVIGVALTVAVARRTGTASLAGLGRAAFAAFAATAAAIGAARGLIALWGHADGIGAALFQGLAVGAATAVAYLAVAAAIDGHDMIDAMKRRAGRIRPNRTDDATPDRAATESGDDQ